MLRRTKGIQAQNGLYRGVNHEMNLGTGESGVIGFWGEDNQTQEMKPKLKKTKVELIQRRTVKRVSELET